MESLKVPKYKASQAAHLIAKNARLGPCLTRFRRSSLFYRNQSQYTTGSGLPAGRTPYIVWSGCGLCPLCISPRLIQPDFVDLYSDQKKANHAINFDSLPGARDGGTPERPVFE